MYFNEELNKDIQQLKELRRLNLSHQYHQLLAKTMKKHNISKATLYRHMNGEGVAGLTLSNPMNPGAEKINPDAGMFVGDPPAGGQAESEENTADESEAAFKSDEELFKELQDVKLYMKQNKLNFTADVLQNFFRRLFTHAYSGNIKRGGLWCEIPSDKFIMEPGYINDICLIFANAYAYYKYTDYYVNRNEYLLMRVRNLVEQSLRKTGDAWIPFTELEAFTRMFKRLNLKPESAVNFEVIKTICDEFKPGVTLDEIISVYKKKVSGTVSLPLGKGEWPQAEGV